MYSQEYLLDLLHLMQELIAGEKVPVEREFNKAVMDLSSPEMNEILQTAVHILGDDSESMERKNEAMNAVMSFSRTALDLQELNKATHKWLDNDGWEAVVGPEGEIIVRDEKDHSKNITMVAP
jgi:hypothetical protein